MNKPNKLARTGLVVAGLAAAAGITVASCGQTPTNVPIRTFEGAQKVAVVCLQVADPTSGAPMPPTPVAQSLCAPVASGVVGSSLPYHLVATVTQTTRGELAVVDLTGGFVVDEDLSTPGINFIPVGTNPTDVVVAPGARPDFTYVSSASPTKPAIFAIPSNRLLGDSNQTAADGSAPGAPLLLTDLAACSLPQPPVALAILSAPSASADGGGAADGGVPEGGPSDGGSSDGGAGTTGADYQLVALLGEQGSSGARVVVIDHQALESSAPGALARCTISGSTALSADVPTTAYPGPAWPDGVPYLDGGVGDLSAREPTIDPFGVCSMPIGVSDGGALPMGTAPGVDAGADGGEDAAADAAAEDGAVDGGAPVEDAAADAAAGNDAGVASASDGGMPPSMLLGVDAGFPFVVEPGSSPRPVSMVMRDDAPLLYVADSSIPVIHVIDLTHPSKPIEREPLLATSVSQPTRPVHVGSLAFSPPTRDYKRYLYAVDTTAGSLMVFDVTDATDQASPHVPLLRPHAEVNPFVPPDRITFAAPVAAVAFAQHDWPLVLPQNESIAYSGLLCNPNPNAHPEATGAFVDLGAHYRVDRAGDVQPNATAANFPSRLRGIFAFATLTNGTVVTIDVDDWDAPCRRPDPMAAGYVYGSLDVPEPPAASSQDLDPYHAPFTYQDQNQLKESPAVTLEPFFPVSAPNRVRSSVLVRNDPTNGDHVPSLVQPPQLVDVNGNPVATSGKAGVAAPRLLPTGLEPGFADPTIFQNPTEPNPDARTVIPGTPDGGVDGGFTPNPQDSPPAGVRLSFDDPTVQQSQDWTVTYEGVLPSSPGIVATIASTTPGAYTTLTFSTQGANLCGLGVEDWAIGQARAKAALTAMSALTPAGSPSLVSKAEATLPQWTSDYVEITDDILPSNDQYWGIRNDECWKIPEANGDGGTGALPTNERYNLCQATFGAPGTNPDFNINRDAPILEAYADHLQVGRFGHTSSMIERTENRTVDPGGPNNPPFLNLMACCFHNQAAFKVRAGGEWVAVGQQGLGLLHHVVPISATGGTATASAGRCVLSCDPQDRLLNARSFDVPWASSSNNCAPTTRPTLDRNSPLAVRNPMFSYVTWAGCGGMPMTGDHTLSARDLSWKFSVIGGFSPLTVSLGGTSGAQVSPQSMLFVNSLGELAVVDGADQGLVLIDLNSVAFSINYF